MKRVLARLAILAPPALAWGEGSPPSARWFGPDLGRPVEIPADMRSIRDFAQLAYKGARTLVAFASI